MFESSGIRSNILLRERLSEVQEELNKIKRENENTIRVDASPVDFWYNVEGDMIIAFSINRKDARENDLSTLLVKNRLKTLLLNISDDGRL